MLAEPITKPELKALIGEAVAAALQSNVTPQLLEQTDAAAYCGLPRSTWFRLRSEGELPEPVNVKGSGMRWRRRDLDQWLARLKPRRK